MHGEKEWYRKKTFDSCKKKEREGEEERYWANFFQQKCAVIPKNKSDYYFHPWDSSFECFFSVNSFLFDTTFWFFWSYATITDRFFTCIFVIGGVVSRFTDVSTFFTSWRRGVLDIVLSLMRLKICSRLVIYKWSKLITFDNLKKTWNDQCGGGRVRTFVDSYSALQWSLSCRDKFFWVSVVDVYKCCGPVKSPE